MFKELKRVYRKTEEVIERKIGSAIVLIPLRPADLQNQHIFSLEGVGRDIWQLIDGQKSVEQILENLFQEFAVEKSQLLTDLLEFLEQLKVIGGIIECQSVQTSQK